MRQQLDIENASVTNPYEPLTQDFRSRPPKEPRAARWKLFLLFALFLLLLNGLLFDSLRNTSGWGVIGVLHIIAPALNLISGIVALVACLCANKRMRGKSLGWFYFASVCLPFISYLVLYLLAMYFVDAHGC